MSRNDKLLSWGTLAGVLVAAVPLACGAIAYEVRVRCDVSALKAASADHENRLRGGAEDLGELRKDMAVVRNDVGWLRRHFDPAKPDQQASK